MKIVFLTDIHIGAPKVYLDRIHESLRKYAYPEIETAQLLLLGGDFFDCLLNLNSDAGIIALFIIDELIELAVKNHIYVRVLRGTFSHDRYQNRLFIDRAREIPMYKDIPLIRIIEKIEVERFTPYNLDILYCPDDQPYEDVTQAILDVLDANHLDAVDYFCCHGFWDHLLPSTIPTRPHNCLDYNKLESKVRCHIFNGHVHSPSIWNKVISGGSFERFRHAEEEDKGFWTAEYDPDKHTSIARFIRNKEAVPFITIDLSLHPSTEEVMSYLDRRVEQAFSYENALNRVMHIRLIGDGSAVMPAMKDKYPYAVFTEKHITEAKKEDMMYQTDITHDLPLITVSNLPDLIYDNVHQKYPELTRDRIKEILDGTGTD